MIRFRFIDILSMLVMLILLNWNFLDLYFSIDKNGKKFSRYIIISIRGIDFRFFLE